MEISKGLSEFILYSPKNSPFNLFLSLLSSIYLSLSFFKSLPLYFSSPYVLSIAWDIFPLSITSIKHTLLFIITKWVLHIVKHVFVPQWKRRDTERMTFSISGVGNPLHACDRLHVDPFCVHAKFDRFLNYFHTFTKSGRHCYNYISVHNITICVSAFFYFKISPVVLILCFSFSNALVHKREYSLIHASIFFSSPVPKLLFNFFLDMGFV